MNFNLKNFVLVSFISVLNFWVWRILQTNPILALTLILTSLISLFYLITLQKKCLLVLLILMGIIFYYQWGLTNRINLIELSSPQQHAQNERVVSYPIKEMNVTGKTFHYPLGNLFDGRKETIAFYRLQQNLFESLDLNYYFSATHPRERVGIIEFEKFPFIYLPFFVIGLFLIQYQKIKLFLCLTFIVPLLLLTFIGPNSTLGSFVLFPFVLATILFSVYTFLNKFIFKPKA